ARREQSLEEMTEAAGASSGDPAPELPLLSDAGAAAQKIRNEMDASPCGEMFRKTLAQALERLTPEENELIRYRYFKGLKGREIAAIRGVQEYVISKQLKKALARLEKRVLMTATTLFGFSSKEVRDCLEATRS
ncbi:MAG: sigma-70 family RNA polymerase sigma factor, partial [Candidatus Sumerlaeota bacterium]|nr:sigma-70 family RNA polymerase sigma factor [Candidatus Sumerlaeota bacterium]